MKRSRYVLAALLAAIVLFVVFFDWNWFRGPLERYVSKKTHREFTISDLHVRLGLNPTIRMRDLVFANAPWAGDIPMARIGILEFSVSLRDLVDGHVLIPRVALTQADLRFKQAADKRKNWTLSDPSDKSPSKLRISSLSLTRGHLEYDDLGIPAHLAIEASTFDPQALPKASDAKAAPDNSHYATQFDFAGTYHDAKFSGQALTGDVLSFQESGVTFPLKGHLVAGTTTLDVQGTVADAADISGIDVNLKIAGKTLANLYPFLALPLPASPPYSIAGRLTLKGNRFGLDQLDGQIGATDIEGNGAYLRQSPRPLLQANLHSRLLRVADLGPVIGVETKSSPAGSKPTQASTSNRPVAQAKEREKNGDKVLPTGTSATGDRLLPSGKFEGGRLKAIDAEVRFAAERVEAPQSLSVRNVEMGLALKDAVLTLDPLKVDIAGGTVQSKVGLDARGSDLKANLDVAARQLHLAELMPSNDTVAKAQGVVGGRIKLSGVGDSIADLAAKSNGDVSAVMSRARISNLVDAAAGLNGGKLLQLLVAGDKQIAVRCGVVDFGVKNGLGTSRVFVIDTEQTRIDGSGTFDLNQEKFDLQIKPEPKHASLLSLRTPLRLYGSFRHPDYALDKKDLLIRGGGALALLFTAPLAALIPLVETGPGTDADCSRLAATARSDDKPVAHR